VMNSEAAITANASSARTAMAREMGSLQVEPARSTGPRVDPATHVMRGCRAWGHEIRAAGIRRRLRSRVHAPMAGPATCHTTRVIFRNPWWKAAHGRAE
jgi:hypothetical protein